MTAEYPVVAWVDDTPGRYFARLIDGAWAITKYSTLSSGPGAVAAAHPHAITYLGYSADAGETWGGAFLSTSKRVFTSVLRHPTLFIGVTQGCDIVVSQDRRTSTTRSTCPLTSLTGYDLSEKVLDAYLDELDVLHIVGTYGSNVGRYYTRSTDYGVTWSTPVKVLEAGASTPLRVFARGGKVVAGYYSPQYRVSYNYWYSGYFGMTWLYIVYYWRYLYTNISLDNGLTWGGQITYAPEHPTTGPNHYYAMDYLGYNAPCFFEEDGDLCLVTMSEDGDMPAYYEGGARPPVPYKGQGVRLFRNAGWGGTWDKDDYVIGGAGLWTGERAVQLRAAQSRNNATDQVWCVGGGAEGTEYPDSLKVYNSGAGWAISDLYPFPGDAEFPWPDIFDLSVSVPYYPPSTGFAYLF